MLIEWTLDIYFSKISFQNRHQLLLMLPNKILSNSPPFRESDGILIVFFHTMLFKKKNEIREVISTIIFK